MHKAYARFVISLFVLNTVVPLAQAAQSYEQAGQREFNRVRGNPIELRRFLYQMPKGGDLHYHLAGGIYAESFIDWAADDGKCINLSTWVILMPPCDSESGRTSVAAVEDNWDSVNRVIDAFSVRNYEWGRMSGHDQFFSTFGRFMGAAAGREGDMVAEVTARAARQNVLYLELMLIAGMQSAQSLGMDDETFDLDRSMQELLYEKSVTELLVDTQKQIDAMELRWKKVLRCDQIDADPGCGVTVRYLAQVIRIRPREQVLAQILLAVRLMAADDRYVGLNLVGREDDPIALRDYKWQMQQIAAATKLLPESKRKVTLHAGELAMGLVPPEYLGQHVRQAIDIAGARRIGHGVDIVHDTDYPGLMTWMAEHGIAVEINFTSNDVILGIKGAEHPFESYRHYRVPVTLSTDDEGVSRIDLTHEYQRAVETYLLSYTEIKQLSRNSLAYSFLPGESLFKDIASGLYVKPCRIDSADLDNPEGRCADFLASSEKARLQWDLEAKFMAFEAQFK